MREEVTIVNVEGGLSQQIAIRISEGDWYIQGFVSYSLKVAEEHITWVRGWHDTESETGQALLAAHALSRNRHEHDYGMFMTVGFNTLTLRANAPTPPKNSKNEL